MSRTLFSAFNRGSRWLTPVLAAVCAEAVWLGLLYPLVPVTLTAWTATLGFPVLVGICVWGVVTLLGSSIWPVRHTLAQRILAIVLAVSPGLVLFIGFFVVQYLLPGAFRIGF